MDKHIIHTDLITLFSHYYNKMNNEVNEVGEYLFYHLLLGLFCWKKLGENEVFTALSLTAMGLTRNPLKKRGITGKPASTVHKF